ncbi:MAG: type II toxin-antitoxin system RelE/ParE family toxin [Bacteroidota bacterium]
MVGKLFKIIFSKKANQQLREISNYHTRADSPATGQKIRRGIVDQTKTLRRFPNSKPLLPDSEDLEYEARYTKAWSYKIIFRVFDPTRIVRILSIRHDKENPKEIEKDL